MPQSRLHRLNPHESVLTLHNFASSAAVDWEFLVFISHAGPIKPFAAELRDDLDRLGFGAFLDEYDLHPGDDADCKMEACARNSPIRLVLLSREFPERKWPMRELKLIVEAESLLPVIVGMSHTEFKDTWRASQGASHLDEAFFKKVTRTTCIIDDGGWRLFLRQKICFAVLRVFVEKMCPRLPNVAQSMNYVNRALTAAKAISSGHFKEIRIRDSLEAGSWALYLENLHEGRVPWGTPFCRSGGLVSTTQVLGQAGSSAAND